jgi:hypothetical protein
MASRPYYYVAAVMHTVSKVHIQVSSRSEHYLGPIGLAFVAMAGDVRLIISLGFDNPYKQPHITNFTLYNTA